MKKLFSSMLACLVMSACSDSDKATVSDNDSVSAEDAVSVDTTPAVTDGKMSIAGDLPSHWVLLTKKGNTLVVQNYCNKENPSLVIEDQDDGTTTIARNMGMLSEVYKVVSFQKINSTKYLIRGEGLNGEGTKFLKINYSDPFKGLAECSWATSAEDASTDAGIYVTYQKMIDYPIETPSDCK